MSVVADIFNPQTSKVAKGLEGKTIMIYGGNNLGKTYVASKLKKPFFISTESGLNAIGGVQYISVRKWSDFKKLIKQLTDSKTVDKAREMYDTIVIDEVYASSIMCQDFCIATYGDGALTLSDGDYQHNLYSLYEKEYFRIINLLLSCDYTVVFIGHEQEKDNCISPKGDKRCIKPIIDNCDFVIYLTSNGIDDQGNVIHSSGHLAETETYFARSRFTKCPTLIEDFTAENLEATIKKAVEDTAKADGIEVVSYDEQKEQNIVEHDDFNTIMEKLQNIGIKFAEAEQMDELTEIVENTLGKGKKVSECTKKQTEALEVIYDALVEKAEELKLS